MLITQETITQL